MTPTEKESFVERDKEVKRQTRRPKERKNRRRQGRNAFITQRYSSFLVFTYLLIGLIILCLWCPIGRSI